MAAPCYRGLAHGSLTYALWGLHVVLRRWKSVSSTWLAVASTTTVPTRRRPAALTRTTDPLEALTTSLPYVGCGASYRRAVYSGRRDAAGSPAGLVAKHCNGMYNHRPVPPRPCE